MEQLGTVAPILETTPPSVQALPDMLAVQIRLRASPPLDEAHARHYLELFGLESSAVCRALSAASTIELTEPWRTGASIREALDGVGCADARQSSTGTGEPRLLLLPELPPDAVSASSSAIGLQQRAPCWRALATPSARIQELITNAAAAAIAGAAAPVASSSRDAPATVQASAAFLRPLHLWFGELGVLNQVVQERVLVRVVHDAVRLLEATRDGAASHAVDVVVVPEARAMGAEPELGRGTDEQSLAAAVAPLLRSRGFRVAVLPLFDLAPLDAAFGVRWLCATAPLLLLPLHGHATAELVTARQALGKPIDHSFFDQHAAAVEEALNASPDEATEDPTAEEARAGGQSIADHVAAKDERSKMTVLAGYDSFLTRTESLLRQLPFAPPLVGSSERVAVIVEPRSDPSIVRRTAYVIRNVCAFLNGATEDGHGPPPAEARSWSIQWFHGTANRQPVAAHFSGYEFARISCTNLGVDNLRSSHEYSQLLTSHWFWEKVAAEVVLIFQV